MADTTEPTGWKARYGDLVLSIGTKLAIALLGALAAWLGIAPKVIEKTVTVEKVVNVGDVPPGPFTGWVDDKEEVKKVVATLQFPVFSQTPAGQADQIPDHVYQWEIAKQAIGKYIPTRNQKSVGSCTAFGAIGPCEIQLCVQIVAAKKAAQPPPQFVELAQEANYGFSRVDILGGRIRGDGSTGAAAAKACLDYGVAPRKKYDSVDLSEYDEATCRRMGDRGVPDDVRAAAAKHKVKSISPVRTTTELRKGLAAYYTVSIASNVGFGNSGPYVRDADGVLKPSGTWAHQMYVLGYTNHPSRGWLYFIMNSWGEKWVGGPKGAGDPPDGGFWVTEATMQRILDAADSWFFDGVGGFERKPLDWAARPVRHPVHLALTSHPFGDVQCDRFALSP